MELNLNWKKLAKEDEKEIKTYCVYNENGAHTATIIGNIKKPEDIDFSFILAKNWILKPISIEPSKLNHAYTGNTIWECGCEKNFIRSSLNTQCDKCGKQIGEIEPKFKKVKKLISWDNFLIDCKGEKVYM